MGIPAAPRGVPQIEVSFDIDANGILNVSAKDLGTNKEQSIKIESSSGLTDDEIEKMKSDAEAYAEVDKKKQELINVRNQADSLIYTTEKTLKEHGNMVSNEERGTIENAISDLKEAMKTEDVSTIMIKIESLQKASYSISEKLYKQSEAAQKASTDTSEQKPEEGEAKEEGKEKEEGEVEADFEVIDEKEEEGEEEGKAKEEE
jgi:molecular chaperone DnaK